MTKERRKKIHGKKIDVHVFFLPHNMSEKLVKV